MTCRVISIIALVLFSSAIARSQENYEIGVSYRYIRYNEAMFSLAHLHDEYLNPHELDINFRFDIGDPNLCGTLNLGWARYSESDIYYNNPLFETCDSPWEIDAIASDQHAYRFNPGIEYSTGHEKISYGFGAGVFYYGTFRGNRIETYTTMYMHTDSISGDCVDDSVHIQVLTNRARARGLALIGLSAHLFAGYQVATGITMFVSFSVNPVFSTKNHYFALAPSGSVGVYFRFRSRQTVK